MALVALSRGHVRPATSVFRFGLSEEKLMGGIYQDIWDADQSGAGLKAIFDDAVGDQTIGFV
ncbi:hypothetical protein REMIM1_PE00549 (plasmid) [Rhizobium etli bv. mimosae str. Mim1]|nr:hypothetical protein REMIM1_PE00549 [Rhizobium etli bv. mimosae str. Mim1]